MRCHQCAQTFLYAKYVVYQTHLHTLIKGGEEISSKMNRRYHYLLNEWIITRCIDGWKSLRYSRAELEWIEGFVRIGM